MEVRCQCPVCAHEMVRDEGDLDKLIDCPRCRGPVRPESMEAVRAARERRLSGVKQTLLAKEAALRMMLATVGEASILPTGIGGRFRKLTIAAGITFPVCAAALVLGKWAVHHKVVPLVAEVPLMIVPFFLGLAALIWFVVGFLFDLTLPGPSKRTTPLRGLKAFLGSIRRGRYAYAYKCLLPSERNETERERPNLRLPGLDRDRKHSFATEEGFRGYWCPLAGYQLRTGRTTRTRGYFIEREEDDFAHVQCAVEVYQKFEGPAATAAYPVHFAATFLLGEIILSPGGRAIQLGLRKLLRRVDGQWYVVNGELGSPEDTLEAFEEAVRISKLSDAELAAEAEAAGLQS